MPVVLNEDWPFSDVELPVLVVRDWEEAKSLLKHGSDEVFQRISKRPADRAFFNYYAKSIFATD